MNKNNTKRNIIIAFVSVALVVAFIVYMVKSNNEKVEQKAMQEAEQERLEVLEEQIVKDKKESYYNYMGSIENLIDSLDYDDVVRVAELSDYYLYSMNSSGQKDYFQQTHKGNEYLEKLNEEATSRLNSALYNLYNNGIEYMQYNEVEDYKDNSNSVHEDNIAFFKKEKQRYDKRERNELIEKQIQEKKQQNPRLGMTKKEVEASSWGKPKKVNRTVTLYSTEEQWVYGQDQYLYFEDGILTSFQD